MEELGHPLQRGCANDFDLAAVKNKHGAYSMAGMEVSQVKNANVRLIAKGDQADVS